MNLYRFIRGRGSLAFFGLQKSKGQRLVSAAAEAKTIATAIFNYHHTT
ncbi:hypothetical protein [Methylomonas koyamae]|nr:hypothetical protein [Methylomonas koyamae]